MAFNGHVTANNDLDEQQLFLDIPEVARIIGRDARTVRRCVESGEIPGQKFGARWSVPTSWVRQQAGVTEAASVARLARLVARGVCGDGQDPEAV
jgi:Helix-turn-helix domain